MRINKKKFIYLISPNKIYKKFFKDLQKVIETGKISFFQLRLKKYSLKHKISIGKKIKVVKAIVDHLNLENVYPVHNRVENLIDPYHYAITRAVAPVKNLVSLTEKLWINKNDAKIYALKGGDLSNEIKGYKTRLHSINKWLPQTYFNQKFIVEIKLF